MKYSMNAIKEAQKRSTYMSEHDKRMQKLKGKMMKKGVDHAKS